MKTTWITTVIICTLLTACDSAVFDDGPRAEIRKSLNDPDSAKFGKRVAYENWTCIEYNAKNAFGGYVGFRHAILEQVTPDYLSVRETNAPECDKDELVRRSNLKKLAVQAEQGALDEMKKRKLVATSITTSSIYDLKDKACKDKLQNVLTSYRLAYDPTEVERRDYWLKKGKEELETIDTAICHL